MNKNQDYDSEEKIVFIETTYDAIKDFNIEKSNVTYIKGKPYFKAKTSKKVYIEYNRMIEIEKKKEFRNNRCEISTKDGKTIRCPDKNKCQGCKYEDKKKKYIDYTDEDINFASDESVENNAIMDKTLEYFENKLNEVNLTYGKIFQYIYEGAKPQEIAEELMVDVKTVYADIRKIRKILQPIAREWGFGI